MTIAGVHVVRKKRFFPCCGVPAFFFMNMKKKPLQSGLTLVDVLVGASLLVGGGTALLWAMHSGVIQADYLSQFQVAMNAAEGELEELSATSFDTLWTGAEYAAARANGQGVALTDVPQGQLAIQIRNADVLNPMDPSLLDLHVAACWTSRGRRIGEDQNCNGALDAGEDTNANGWIDSPAEVSTRIAKRE